MHTDSAKPHTHLEVILDTAQMQAQGRWLDGPRPLARESEATTHSFPKDCDIAPWREQITTVQVWVAAGTESPAMSDVRRFIVELPAVRRVAIRMEASAAPRYEAFLKEWHKSLRKKGKELVCEILLDGDANVDDALRDLPNSLTVARSASKRMRDHHIPVRWIVPLVAELVFRLERLFSLASDDQCEAILVSLAQTSAQSRELTPEETLFSWDFVTYGLLMQGDQAAVNEYVRLYTNLQAQLCGARRQASVERASNVVFEGPVGRFQTAARVLTSPPVATLPEDHQVGRAGPFTKLPGVGHAAHLLDVGRVLLDGLSAMTMWSRLLLAEAGKRRSAMPADQRLGRVIVIGAYGGEHIGDMAILGGVLTRMARQHGTTQAVLMTQRPKHTRHLVEMLELPVEIDVKSYEHEVIREQLSQVDAVVFAGGPMMDLPKQLVRHLYTVSRARLAGKPFIIEGIGAGPFVRRASWWVARRLTCAAEKVSVRTLDDARHSVLRGCNPEPGHDPAFDYLATRKARLPLVTPDDRAWLETLLHDSQEHALIGINVRPIRHEFTASTGRRDQLAYTQLIESQFERRLAEGLKRFQAASPRPTRFIFFPMNAIQFGLSDLRSAYRIGRLLGSDVDFRVWESDASLEGVVSLMRRLDVVVAMRFHAVIFALSQGRPVVGIDYRVGKRDKVAAILSDMKQSENCARIDTMSADWLATRLGAICPSVASIERC